MAVLLKRTNWFTVVSPYSLAVGRVGEPIAPPTKWQQPTEIDSMIHLGNLIFGAHWKTPYEVAGRGNAFRIYAESPDGEELAFEALYRRVETLVGESGRPTLHRTMDEIIRYRDLYHRFPR